MSDRRRVLSVVAIAWTALAGIAAAQEPGRYDHYTIYDTDLPPRAEYAARRGRVLSALEDRAALLVRAADVKNRSNDIDYEFRQRNNLLYLTGVTEDESALLIVPHGITINGTVTKEVLFVKERNASSEVWTGITMGPATAAKVTGIQTVLPYSQLSQQMKQLLPTIGTLYYDDWKFNVEREPLTGTAYAWEEQMLKQLEAINPSLVVKNAGIILNPLRLVKSPNELALMQRAIDASIKGHRQTIRTAKPGMYEYQFEAVMEYGFQRNGARWPGYPSIVGSGPNTCILHYETNRRKSEPGDLVLMDCGAEYHGYSADITRTFPVNGTFTPEQRTLYDLVLQAQNAGIAECLPGNDFRDPHRAATKVIADGLIKLGIIQNSGQVGRYFMHGTSHYLGLDVHDVGDYGALVPGVVLTVEPGIYIKEGSPCDPKWWNIGIRIEDDILVTEQGPHNMSAALERTAQEIERLMNAPAEKPDRENGEADR
ncbi:MAG: aminopeptidase P N-terminal domain-containing protein [Chlorobi bacterium]|nr:MAG: Xaa-Pro aminopeptidase [Chlorobi bacterium OLB7]MBK8911866.1 aminopeptidase P N-terminal domain-containing protein [Chlorobiota bacterium]MBX7215492.1 aminopeptidase P N-terminal domain-containing protein [Candidatus Kapabacteria bacterium]